MTVFHKLLVLALSFAILASPAFGQNPSIVIEPDVRVFAVLAALQQAGVSPTAGTASSAASSINQELQGLPTPLRQRLQDFCKKHMEGGDSEDQFAKYISLALLTEGPPDFKLVLPAAQLPPDALSVADFLDLVREFYVTAKLEQIWSAHQAQYDQVMLEQRPVINEIILHTDGYLRIPSGSFLDRRLFIIPDLLAPTSMFNARTYRENYYLVFGPSEKLSGEEFRHQYLHFLLDPYPLRFPLTKETRTELLKFVESAPGIDSRYKTDLPFMVSESLIRAIELRINRVPDEQASIELNSAIHSGALLAFHFYRELKNFETLPEGIRIYYPSIAKAVAVDKIQLEFAEAQKSAPLAQRKAEPRELNELEKLLRKANEQLGTNELEGAAGDFQKILDTLNPENGAAFYGLGLVASIKNRKDLAKDYFLKALASPSSDNSVKVWAHIYLGRILDLEDNRSHAMKEYQSAIDLGDDTRNAQAVARKGLTEAFKAKKPDAR